MDYDARRRRTENWGRAGTAFGIVIVAALVVLYFVATSQSAPTQGQQSSGSSTHTECYQSTAVVPGYSGATIIHENILYDAHNNILSRQSSLGSC